MESSAVVSVVSVAAALRHVSAKTAICRKGCLAPPALPLMLRHHYCSSFLANILAEGDISGSYGSGGVDISCFGVLFVIFAFHCKVAGWFAALMIVME